MTVQANIAERTPSNDTFDLIAAGLAPVVAAPAVPELGAVYPFLKRVLDLAIAIPVLVLSSPFFAFLALAIRFDSKGPGLFFQTRLGRGGKPFNIVKFRTMHVQENGENVVQARRHDPRITRLGRALRATSIDELPQLINVIRGEMSIVGPRPHAIAHDRLYGVLIGNYELRQAVKPGITGWAQINGARGETPAVEDMRRRVDLDVWYARHASLLLDLEILLRTPFELVRSRNAY